MYRTSLACCAFAGVALANAAQAAATTAPAVAVNPTNLPALSEGMASAFVVISAAAGFAFAMYWWYVTSEISIEPGKDRRQRNEHLTDEIMRNVYIISKRVSEGRFAARWARSRLQIESLRSVMILFMYYA